MLRVIAGKYKGLRLEQPSLKVARPTIDRIKESIFSMIQFDIESKIVLDLFSGSGSFAIEAISRGALKAIAVDSNREAISIINENKNKLKISNLDVIQTDAIYFLKSKTGAKFDVIFIDPPYDNVDLYNQSLEIIANCKLLSDYGMIVIEKKFDSQIALPQGFAIYKSKLYGKIEILILRNII